jgi:hypothetical protein
LDLSIVRAWVIGGPLGQAGARWLGRGIPAAVFDGMAAFEALRGGLLLPPAPHRSPGEPKRLRPRLFSVAGRIVRGGRRLKLRLSARWPWTDDITAAINRLQAMSPG